jgi:hypothetical protein
MGCTVSRNLEKIFDQIFYGVLIDRNINKSWKQRQSSHPCKSTHTRTYRKDEEEGIETCSDSFKSEITLLCIELGDLLRPENDKKEQPSKRTNELQKNWKSFTAKSTTAYHPKRKSIGKINVQDHSDTTKRKQRPPKFFCTDRAELPPTQTRRQHLHYRRHKWHGHRKSLPR